MTTAKTTVETKTSVTEYWAVRCEVNKSKKVKYEYYTMSDRYKDQSATIDDMWYNYGYVPFKSRNIKSEDDANICRARLIERFQFEVDDANKKLANAKSLNSYPYHDYSYLEDCIKQYEHRLNSKIEVVKIKKHKTLVTEVTIP